MWGSICPIDNALFVQIIFVQIMKSIGHNVESFVGCVAGGSICPIDNAVPNLPCQLIEHILLSLRLPILSSFIFSFRYFRFSQITFSQFSNQVHCRSIKIYMKRNP